MSPKSRRCVHGFEKLYHPDYRRQSGPTAVQSTEEDLGILMNVQVRFEQAVYGSFPFWQRGYGVLARSADCRPEWLAALKTACQRYGERPAGAIESDALFAMRMDRGPWMIVGVYPQGCDDQGRPGALAFHSLFVSRLTYAWAGADPFAFADLLRRDWSLTDLDAKLPSIPQTIPRASVRRSRGLAPSDDERFVPIVEALVQGRRVALLSPQPIDTLARSVWRALSWRIRLRASVATWAFDNMNGFDLAALPKISSIRREPTDLILA